MNFKVYIHCILDGRRSFPLEDKNRSFLKIIEV